MKRHGQLFALYAQPDALLQAYRRARKEKRNSRGCFLFERNLGANIHALHDELVSRSYQPQPVNAFWINDGRKPRLIEAPSFRDLVAQHAVYAVVGPLFERRYIATSFACRNGLGTHAAADWLQAAMRRAPRTAWTLHVDARKFFTALTAQPWPPWCAKSSSALTPCACLTFLRSGLHRKAFLSET
jgi:retron-type reverse transcriptase